LINTTLRPVSQTAKRKLEELKANWPLLALPLGLWLGRLESCFFVVW